MLPTVSNPEQLITHHQGMAGLLSMPLPKLLTYQDLLGPLQVQTVRTVARILKDCPRLRLTRSTIRFREIDVQPYLDARMVKPGPRRNGIKRTRRPVSA